VFAKVRERLAVSKEESQNSDFERFSPSKLCELEVRKQYQIKTSNSFAALENLNDSEDINGAWEIIKDNNTSAEKCLGQYALKQHNPQFD